MSWYQRAACKGQDPDIWYPGPQGSDAAAVKVCVRCTVSEECLNDALKTGEQRGVRAGLSAEARRRMRRSRGVA